jgi:hypothetical protein
MPKRSPPGMRPAGLLHLSFRIMQTRSELYQR